mgnify:CR=1 FL=1
MAKKSKQLRAALEKIDSTKAYSVEEAVALAKETNFAKFDATVEVAYNLNIDVKKADQQIRGAMVLPNGTGKTQRVLVFARGAKAEEAKVAGADFVGEDDLVAKINDGWLDFDVVIATPDMMALVGRLGRVLGPRNLMPNPKTGTVTMDVAKAVEESKGGKITYRADQQIRGAMVLPNGTGKTQRVLVFARGAKAEEAKVAGADFVGEDDLVAKINDGWLDFDVVIATPDMMALVGRLGRVLGPRNLMPNPKTGTVTMDVAKAVEESKGGKITYRADRAGNVQAIIGKVSFDADKLVENFKAFNDTIQKAKPATAKGTYVTNLSITTTQGPGIKVDVSSL